jgi:ADP-heptose:LPS heptosyltransferase
MAGELTLPEMGGLLQEMDLLVANDSGPVHVAAAVGTPALVVFGPTDPRRTGPYGDKHRVLSASVPCRPCFSRTCRRPGIPCLAGVTPEAVAKAAGEMLSPN